MNKHLQPCVRPSRPKTSPPLLRVPPFPVACLSPRPHVKSRGVSRLPPPAVHWTCPREGPCGPSPASIPRTPRRLLTPRPPRRCSPGSAGLHLSRPFPAYWCCPEPCSWSSPLTPSSLYLEFCSFSVLLTLMKLLTSPHPSPPQLHPWPPSPARRFVCPSHGPRGPQGGCQTHMRPCRPPFEAPDGFPWPVGCTPGARLLGGLGLARPSCSVSAVPPSSPCVYSVTCLHFSPANCAVGASFPLSVTSSLISHLISSIFFFFF